MPHDDDVTSVDTSPSPATGPASGLEKRLETALPKLNMPFLTAAAAFFVASFAAVAAAVLFAAFAAATALDAAAAVADAAADAAVAVAAAAADALACAAVAEPISAAGEATGAVECVVVVEGEGALDANRMSLNVSRSPFPGSSALDGI
eukprot:CAMPEP_0179437924 /NCGR_PEP_ID=MMETSP0799-20121207/21721_1 /TAXON_ID=46947 /ORGANISM="Geminigera cryophila, Strain CCMP2564" /LENGTH=148 /DNA_ID=CAMNT_0021219155 /DNA_START=338 /DNA_END=784 /DNA_ORIENTATION=-